ncbi:hypothetical protein [Latilactobacillus curvatus]|uniref:hypothetical protein n=1 Tax=Latilactobacillus curvatus TaxID=28038 RepID=UPI00240FC643|nr:hypothetical protein [Latilactobacillus curvatus]MDG2980303.1 hypothetical protein [Latilactobacillus curvatus]WCZ54958.1 hypothetical protein [Latilactobacillus phage TMW 1.1365 P1]
MEYQNTKTGFILATECTISGDNWVRVDQSAPGGQAPASAPKVEAVEQPAETPAPAVEHQQEPKVPEVSEDMAGFDGVTRNQIMQELDAQGIKYDPKAKKQVLYDLMMNQGE